MRFKKAGKLLSLILSAAVFLSSVPLSFCLMLYEDIDLGEFNLDCWTQTSRTGMPGDLVLEPGADVSVTDDVYGRCLAASGSGSGGRSVAKTLGEPTEDNLVFVTFDWKPGPVTTAGEFQRSFVQRLHGTPVFRLVKKGGSNGAVQYGVGTTGYDLTGNVDINRSQDR